MELTQCFHVAQSVRPIAKGICNLHAPLKAPPIALALCDECQELFLALVRQVQQPPTALPNA